MKDLITLLSTTADAIAYEQPASMKLLLRRSAGIIERQDEELKKLRAVKRPISVAVIPHLGRCT